MKNMRRTLIQVIIKTGTDKLFTCPALPGSGDDPYMVFLSLSLSDLI